jgi:hypothetical protein
MGLAHVVGEGSTEGSGDDVGHPKSGDRVQAKSSPSQCWEEDDDPEENPRGQRRGPVGCGWTESKSGVSLPWCRSMAQVRGLRFYAATVSRSRRNVSPSSARFPICRTAPPMTLRGRYACRSAQSPVRRCTTRSRPSRKRVFCGESNPLDRRLGTKFALVITIIISSAESAAGWWMSIALSGTRPASRLPMTRATRSTKPRSSSGVDVRRASRPSRSTAGSGPENRPEVAAA